MTEHPRNGGKEQRHPWWTWTALALVLLAVIAVYGPHLAHTTDDGFITYRYARNLADGHGLVFNPGERHLGTTAPGLAVLLGLGAVITGPAAIPVASGILSLAALIVSLGLLCRRLRPDGWLTTLTVALVLACNRWLVEVLGHEGFVVALLCLLALQFTDQGRSWKSGIAWGVATFIRPDSAIMGAVSGLAEWRRRRSFPLVLLVSFLVATGVGAVILVWISGSAIPFSLQVKRAETTAPMLAVGSPYWQSLVEWGQRTWGWGAAPLLVAAVWGWTRIVRENVVGSVAFLVSALAMLVFYPMIGVPFAPWYLVIPLLGVLAGAAVAVSDVFDRGPVILKLVAVVLVVASTIPTVVWSVQLGSRPPDPRAVPMRAAASWIETRSGPPGSAATVEVGFFGFASRRPVLDLMGLGSPGALEALTSSGLTEFFLDQEPAYLIDNPTFRYILDPLVTDPRFRARYEKIHTVAPTVRYPKAITIWQLKPATHPPPARAW